MARLVPLVLIHLDKPRHLRYDLNAMCEVERLTGKAFAELDYTMQTIRIVLWAGLVHEDPELTLQDVGSFIHAGNMEEVQDAVAAAFEAAIPTEETEGEAPKNPSGSTGSNSGPSGAMISD